MKTILVFSSIVAVAIIITSCGDAKRESVETEPLKKPDVHGVSSKPSIMPTTQPSQQMQEMPDNQDRRHESP
jgi:hypothetical protein